MARKLIGDKFLDATAVGCYSSDLPTECDRGWSQKPWKILMSGILFQANSRCGASYPGKGNSLYVSTIPLVAVYFPGDGSFQCRSEQQESDKTMVCHRGLGSL
ncbi:unnamed protein product [Calicophoron daubneyi]|uniref:Uncharacterized protein n=1 Tax=Calicophoron daubneyi TaxID=300641 RepID=A0AAV2TXX9_CALDB